MRIISQDGMIDVPYEQISIEIKENEIWCGYYATLEQHCIAKKFARYSTEAKAKKAMEMLHENYGILCNVSIFATGSAKYMGECYSENELEKIINEYQKINFFQFPADEDVEE